MTKSTLNCLIRLLKLAIKPGAMSVTVCVLLACNSTPQNNTQTIAIQADLNSQKIDYLEQDSLSFKDLNKDGELNQYEDWRLTPLLRANDLLTRMTLEEKAGKLLHGSMSVFGADSYDLEHAQLLIVERGISSVITRLASDANLLARGNNKLQALAEATRLGIPLSISTDPRNHFQYLAGASVAAGTFSKWPEPLGFAAIGDAQLTRQFADIARQEYRAVGIVQALSPMADLATEPRWARVSGTFGENANVAKELTQAYIEGFQNGISGLQKDSVAAVVKHWVGYGAAKDGWDSHSYYGRYAAFRGNNFAQHIVPFEGAFAANVSGVMPAYSILENLVYEGTQLEQVGAGFNHFLLKDLLRDRYGFDGVILSDWAITLDCNEACIHGEYQGEPQDFKDMSTAWGVIDLSAGERYAKALNAGIDQFGGVDDPTPLIEAVKSGLISEERINQSALRILIQKFELGLFEHPFVDEDIAESLVGNVEFNELGEKAQSRAMVLLENKKNLLPLQTRDQKVYLHGVDADTTREFGFTVVETINDADLAIIRTATPYEQPHSNYVFGRMHHEGNLAFEPGNVDHDIILEASAKIPTIVTVYLDRPAVMTAFNNKVSALIGNYGVSDEVFLSTLVGDFSPMGRLPMELPSSMPAVEAQKEDLPHDSDAPLYPYGAGLKYE